MIDEDQENQTIERISQRDNFEDKSFSPSSNKINNNFPLDFFKENKENYDYNKQYEITDNSQSAINPLNKSRNNLNTSSNINIGDIFTAVEYNDLERANELLKQDPSQINKLNEEGLSLLHIAVIKANLKMIDLLLSFGADANILTNKKKQTPLHLAYLNQNSLTEDIVQELLKNDAHDTILDFNSKKPSDYMCSTYKKKKNYNSNNESDKKSYVNNNTGNTVTLITMDNHLDSFLTTNKEDDTKSNQNNTNSNNNTIIQSPNKLDLDYNVNELISINNSVENNNIKVNDLNINNNNNINNNKRIKKRRQYTFGKDEEYNEFLNRNNDIYNEVNNNSNLDNIDINNKYFDINRNEENENKVSNDNILNENENENNNLNDSLENDANKNDSKEIRDNNIQSISLLKNNNIQNENKDNNIQNSFNFNNNSMLTYTDSCIQSKTKLSSAKMPNESNININDNLNNTEEILLKSPFDDNTIEESQNKEKVDDTILKKIIMKKRDSFAKNKMTKKNKSKYSLRKKSFENKNSCSNRVSQFNLRENDKPNYLNQIDSNNILHNINQANTNIYKLSNSYKNSTTVVHNATESGRISGNNSQYSTYTQSLKRKNNINSKDGEKMKITNDSSYLGINFNNNNHKTTEFHYTDINNNYNNSINSSYRNIINLENQENNYKNISYLKYWLNNIGLIEYLDNFTNNSIYDINKLVDQMKSYQTKLNFDNFEPILKIRASGYIYRILCKLEADAGLIDPKIVKFMIREKIGNESKNIIIKNINNNDLKLSISQPIHPCFNCCKLNQIKKGKKDNLKYFLIKYDLMNLYQNFYHNGFDMIEYVIMQMYSSFPINEDILENHFHMYDEKQREVTLKAIVCEMKKINKFLMSEEYNNNCDKNKIKYDNVFLENNENYETIKLSDNKNESDCSIF